MRSRTAASGATEVARQEAAPKSSTLKFNEPLTWRAGKPIAVGELLKRLQSLANELSKATQQDGDRESYTSLAKELASQNLVGHKDKGVRAWTACCLVDLLRLCAPDAPFTPSQLKDVFTLFVASTIPAVADPMNPYHAQHLYVLESLSEVKSIILITDIPSSNSLILRLFTTCFDVMSHPVEELSRKVEHCMTNMLVTVVDECPILPSEVIDIILSQFMRAASKGPGGADASGKKFGALNARDESQLTLLQKQLPSAYSMAQNICNTCSDRMSRYIGQYFSNVIVDASGQLKDDTWSHSRSHQKKAAAHSDDEDEGGPSDDDFKELQKAHALVRELWRSAPNALSNIIPQVEAELMTENIGLRLLATETIGDMVSGIGSAGPPTPKALDPAAYPPLRLNSASGVQEPFNQLLTPASPKPFLQVYASAYRGFLGRRNDKTNTIRAAWTTCVGWIISTRAGGSGLGAQEEQDLVRYLSQMLVDGDEKVRLAAIRAIALFSFKDIVGVLGLQGGISDSGSLFSNLADRVKDRKPAVRAEALLLLGKTWGVATGEISSGNSNVKMLLGPIPSRILDAVYVNDLELNALIDGVMFEALLPLSYPPTKSKAKHQIENEAPQNGIRDLTLQEADRMRTQRLLLLVSDLDQRAKAVFFAMLSRPRQLSDYVEAFLKRADDYNGGVMDKKDPAVKQHMSRLIGFLSRTFPDPSKAADDLWRFAKLNDRRNYNLIRFCKAADSDYRKIYRSLKELMKRLESATSANSAVLETIQLLIYRSSNFLYNKSHVPAIIEFSQSNDQGLGNAAHEVLNEISVKCPSIFKAHVDELCHILESQAPKTAKTTDQGAADALKACAGFARRFPQEIPKERKFFQAMVQYALRASTPKAAKHAATIIMVSADKKEMYARDLIKKCSHNFKYGSDDFLAKLATIGQVLLLASEEVEGEIDEVVDIAVNQVLMKVRHPASDDDADFRDDPDEECKAKMWALRILVNQLRSYQDVEMAKDMIKRVYKLLNTLIENNGELLQDGDTPIHHKSQLRLYAAHILLKICTKKGFDGFLSGSAFNQLATVAQDPSFQVRQRFLDKLKKYLGQDRLPARFNTIPFLVAFEPSEKLKRDTSTWIRARTNAFEKANLPVLELTFSRLLSVLAHHPDFGSDADDLAGFVPYIVFYLRAVASEDNLSLIYHIAQRVKSVQDAIDPNNSENLYYLSDLAQAVIRQYEDVQNWSMQAYAGKAKLPSLIFSALPSHEVAQKIATEQYLPEEVIDQLENLVKGKNARPKKRRSDSDAEEPPRKRMNSSPVHKSKSLPVRKAARAKQTPKAKRQTDLDEIPSSERRKSARSSHRISYAETSDAGNSENPDSEED